MFPAQACTSRQEVLVADFVGMPFPPTLHLQGLPSSVQGPFPSTSSYVFFGFPTQKIRQFSEVKGFLFYIQMNAQDLPQL